NYGFTVDRGQGFVTHATGLAESVQIVTCDSTLQPNSSEAIEQVLERWSALSPRPTGLFVPTDLATVSVYRKLNDRKIRPGADVEIVSCDKREDQLSMLDPQPMSIDLNREVIARLAVERLLWRMREGMESPSVRIVVGPKLDGYST